MIDQALAYFKEGNAFDRLFSLFKKKYESIGRVGGTVKIDDFNSVEVDALAGFFGVNSTDLLKRGKVSLSQFEEQLQRTRFEGIGLKELLEAYFRQPLISKKEAKEFKLNEQVELLEQLKGDFGAIDFWFEHLLKRTADTHWIFRLMDEDKTRFLGLVENLSIGFRGLPSRLERLPMFSQRITSNPHAFDRNTDLGKLWIHLLAVHHQQGSGQVVVPTDSEGMNDLLLSYQLLRDDITNFVTCANLIARSGQGVHPMWEMAAKMQSVMNVPLREIVALDQAFPANGRRDVWIVENSGVYSSILDEIPSVPLICTHGQFKLASLLLMDLLVEQGCTLYYAGDFDPEGLSMASRLLGRYPDRVKLWKMDVDSYHKSQADVLLIDERLKKLDSIKSDVLAPVIQEMRNKKKAGYQEALVKEMVEELKNC